MRFYRCAECGKILFYKDSDTQPKDLEEIKVGSVDAAREKHIPVVSLEDGMAIAKVGEINHPMIDAHYIEWVIFETDKGYKKIDLKPGEEPVAKVSLNGEKLLRVYELCNLHGIWVKEL